MTAIARVSHKLATSVATAKASSFKSRVIATIGPLEIVTFPNRGGSTSYRVQGTVHGERIRNNFPNEAGARIFANEKVRGLVGGSRRRTVETTLSDAQLAAAEAFFHDLPSTASAHEVLRFYFDHHRPIREVPIHSGPVERGGKIERETGALDEYLEWCETKRKNVHKTINSRAFYIRQFARDANITRTSEFTEEAASKWIYGADRTDHYQRDRYDELNRFAKFLVRRHYLLSNPVTELPRPIVRLKIPGVLNFDQISTLLQCALTDAEGPDMLPFFAIAALSGVRPNEITRIGTQNDGTKTNGWDNIHLEEDQRVIEVNKTKGGQSRRNATICEALRQILMWCKEQNLPANFFSKRKFDRIRRSANVFDIWENDVLRHTYASFSYALNKDVRTLSSDMGNSERVLFSHYIRPVSSTDAVSFFGLTLNWNAPRQRSLEGQRIDVWLKKPTAELTTEELRVLRTRLMGEYARLGRSGAPDQDVVLVKAQLERVLTELKNRLPPEKAVNLDKSSRRLGRMELMRQMAKSLHVYERPSTRGGPSTLYVTGSSRG